MQYNCKHESQKTVICILGPPTAGKDTWVRKQMEFIDAKNCNFTILSGSTILERCKDPNIKSYMDAGKFVPDEIVIPHITNAIQKANGIVILIGIPRTIYQAKKLLECTYIHAVIFLPLSREEAIRRASDRQVCKHCNISYTKTLDIALPKVSGICDNCGCKLCVRSDDSAEKAAKRYDDFIEKTYPILYFFEERDITIY